MRIRTLVALGLIGLALIRTVAAAEDPIAQLQQIMRNNSDLEDQAFALLTRTYDPNKAIAVMQKLEANFTLVPTLFSVASEIGSGTPTAAAIASDLDGFKALAAAMIQRAEAAEVAAPNGQKAFALAFLAADDTCQQCHQSYERH